MVFLTRQRCSREGFQLFISACQTIIFCPYSYSIKVHAGLPGVAGCRVLVAAAIYIHHHVSQQLTQPAESTFNTAGSSSIVHHDSRFLQHNCYFFVREWKGCTDFDAGGAGNRGVCVGVYVGGEGGTSGGGGHLAMTISLRLSSPLMYSSEFDKICTQR